jgi:glycosyltransferase involved in cell wall biosynthesis
MPKPTQILFVNSTSEIGGADIDLLLICSHLQRDRYEPKVVLPHAGPLCGEFSSRGIPLIYLDPAPLKRFITAAQILSYPWRVGRAAWALFRLIRQEQVDIVHVNTAVLPAAGLAARLAGVKCVWHIREIEILQRSIVIGALLRWCIWACADRIIAISEAVGKGLGAPARDTLQVIYHCLDTTHFYPGAINQAVRREFKIPAKAKVIGYIGRISPIKGLGYLITALGLIRRQYPETYLLLVGPVLGYQRHLEELHRLVEDQNLTEWVIFSEERQDILEILRAVDVVVLPTVIPEGLGKVLLEGLACGKPVIATNQGGPLEILRDCAAARLVPPRDSTAIAQALQYFWELPPARQQELSQEGYELVKQQHSMSKMIENLEEVYNSLLSS